MQKRARMFMVKDLQVGLALGFMATFGGCRSDGEGVTSTVAPDLRSFPAGRVIPPVGFGVDLVKAKNRTQLILPKDDVTISPAKGVD